MPRSTLACILAAGLLAATCVAQQRIGLALAVCLVLLVAAAATGARRRPPWLLLAIALGLAAQPAIVDAGWVVAIDVVATALAGAVLAGGAADWHAVARAVLSPWRMAVGSAAVARAVPRPGSAQLPAVLRGLGLAAVLAGAFAALFAAGDRAFASLLSFHVDARPLWRLALGAAFVLVGGALASTRRERPARRPARVPGRTELLIALSALVALFAVFVAVQVRVLFGGAAYVRATTGLGYGDYARQGFTELLLVAGLTLGVVAVAARRRDRAVRGLLGALCLLTLVVLWSAHHRLELVEGAFGYTRVRYGGHAVVAWLALVFGLLLAAGAGRRVAARAPRLAAVGTLAFVLAFSLSNPDRRIGSRAVDGDAPVDEAYLSTLSADALPALERLPPARRDRVVAVLRGHLARPDGLAGWNLSRARAR